MSFNDCDCHYKEAYRALSEEYEEYRVRQKKFDFNLIYNLMRKKMNNTPKMNKEIEYFVTEEVFLKKLSECRSAYKENLNSYSRTMMKRHNEICNDLRKENKKLRAEIKASPTPRQIRELEDKYIKQISDLNKEKGETYIKSCKYIEELTKEKDIYKLAYTQNISYEEALQQYNDTTVI